MPQKTIELLHKGILANQQDPYRQGNVIQLPDQGSLIITADLHGHRRNFERIVHFADLTNHPDRHVLLQEIIHGGPQDAQGDCLSYEAILEAVQYKLSFPKQVHFIMGNHDTAFFCNNEVMKDSREMNKALHQALERKFRSNWLEVRRALDEFLFSQPLALRTTNRLWMSHSLPADRLVDQFDPTILERPIRCEDCQKPGSVYILTWGRRMSQPVLDRMAIQFDVDLFILGHQAQPEGWAQAGDNLLILACDHNHGYILHADLSQTYTMESLKKALVPLSSIV